jgi:hypothetical protein
MVTDDTAHGDARKSLGDDRHDCQRPHRYLDGLGAPFAKVTNDRANYGAHSGRLQVEQSHGRRYEIDELALPLHYQQIQFVASLGQGRDQRQRDALCAAAFEIGDQKSDSCQFKFRVRLKR